LPDRKGGLGGTDRRERNMEELIAVALLLVMGVIGGLLHAIIPPLETRRMELLIQVVAGILVAILYGPVLISLDDMMTMSILGAFVVFGPAVIASAYGAMDILKAVVTKIQTRG
jgi:hypothetical protein